MAVAVNSSTIASGSAAEALDLRVTAIRAAADDTNLYEFARPDGAKLPPAEPGAHVDLYLPNGMTRLYSLVIPHLNPPSYTLGIKRDPSSRGGSRYIFDKLQIGQMLAI